MEVILVAEEAALVAALVLVGMISLMEYGIQIIITIIQQ